MDNEKFWSLVDKSGGPSACWPWKGRRLRSGYGVFSVGKSKSGLAHRRALELSTKASLPTSVYCCHRCDNPPCCNPAHLFAGTPTENVRDCKTKGRAAVGERHGMRKLTPDQVTEIRARKAAGEPQTSIAASFGLSQAQVSRIVNNQRWSEKCG